MRFFGSALGTSCEGVRRGEGGREVSSFVATWERGESERVCVPRLISTGPETEEREDQLRFGSIELLEEG